MIAINLMLWVVQSRHVTFPHRCKVNVGCTTTPWFKHNFLNGKLLNEFRIASMTRGYPGKVYASTKCQCSNWTAEDILFSRTYLQNLQIDFGDAGLALTVWYQMVQRVCLCGLVFVRLLGLTSAQNQPKSFHFSASVGSPDCKGFVMGDYLSGSIIRHHWPPPL